MLLTAGILIWALVHLIPAMAPNLRQRVVDSIGLVPYKGLFALSILASLACIIMGFRAMSLDMLYIAPGWTRHITMLLMPIAVILFVAARAPSDIKRFIRHPQLIGVKAWALAHLLSNGETRSVLLFGGLLAWAVLEVIFINRRDGEWSKPRPVGPLRTAIGVIVGIVLTGALMFAHPWLAGIPLITR